MVCRGDNCSLPLARSKKRDPPHTLFWYEEVWTVQSIEKRRARDEAQVHKIISIAQRERKCSRSSDLETAFPRNGNWMRQMRTELCLLNAQCMAHNTLHYFFHKLDIPPPSAFSNEPLLTIFLFCLHVLPMIEVEMYVFEKLFVAYSLVLDVQNNTLERYILQMATTYSCLSSSYFRIC